MSGSNEERLVDNNIVYYPKKVLGRGSDGVFVYSGKFTNRPAAVKRFLKSEDNSSVPREVGVLKEIIHEHIVTYYGYSSNTEFHFIAMELCACTLDDLISNKYHGPSPGDSMTVLHQITQGLAYLHSKNIVHRDLKPRNILISLPADLSSLPKVKLADFGVSKKQKRDNSISHTGSFGTIGWAAPELYDNKNNQSFTKAVDIFSLGCIFGYVLTESHPFGDKLHRSSNVLTGNIVWANQNKITDEKMKTLIIEMISHNPSQRPQISNILKYF